MLNDFVYGEVTRVSPEAPVPVLAVSVAMELRSRILPAVVLVAEEKIVFDLEVVAERAREWRAQGLRIGFTNGCFDLLHPGHVKVLTAARAACCRRGADADLAALRTSHLTPSVPTAASV